MYGCLQLDLLILNLYNTLFMKNFFYLFLFCLPLIVASCGDDDEEPMTPVLTAETIDGAWNLDVFTNSYTIGIDAVSFDATAVISNSNVVMTFNSSDGTWTSTGDFTLTYTDIEGSEVQDLTGGIGEGTYTVTDETLILVGLDTGDEADTSEPIPFTTTSFDPEAEYKGDGKIDVSIVDPIFMTEFSIDGDIVMELSR